VSSEKGTSEAQRLRRDIGLIPLLFSSEGAIIGSGWLFGALYAVNEAGPAALFSWALGGVVVILLALVHAELGAMFPIAGGTARYPHFSYGTLTASRGAGSAGWGP
jgi:amino acid transporter